MALIKCTECGATVSDKADACPKCGAPPGPPPPDETPEEAPEEAAAAGAGQEEEVGETAEAAAVPAPPRRKRHKGLIVTNFVLLGLIVIVGGIQLYRLLNKPPSKPPSFPTMAFKVGDDEKKKLTIPLESRVPIPGTMKVTWTVKEAAPANTLSRVVVYGPRDTELYHAAEKFPSGGTFDIRVEDHGEYTFQFENIGFLDAVAKSVELKVDYKPDGP